MFIFCPYCREKFRKETKRLVCSSCGFEWYPNPKPANAAIITNKQGQLLLGKRKREPGKGKWDLIGGFIDARESAEQSMQREALEEIKANIEKLQYVGSYHDVYHYQKKVYDVVIIVFSGTVEEKSMEADDDILEYRFFDWKNIPYDELAFANMKLFLRDYAARYYGV